MSDLNESRRETNNWIKVLLVLLLLLAAATIYYVVLYPESVLNIGTPASSETTAHLVINEV